MIQIRTSPKLLEHLKTHEFDSATVDALLFSGGRLHYPGRQNVEQELGYTDPYTIDMEARVIDGLSRKAAAAIRYLSNQITAEIVKGEYIDGALELLWATHAAYVDEKASPALDRFVAALVMIQKSFDSKDHNIIAASERLLIELHKIGFPPTHESMEELFDGAPPACVGLGMVDL